MELSFAAAGVPCEDVQNQHRAIDDRQRNDLLEILSLPRAQIVEDQEQLRAFVFCPLRDLARLSASDERRGIDGVTSLHDALEDLGSGRSGERLKLVEFYVDCRMQSARLDGDDNRSLHYKTPRHVAPRLALRPRRDGAQAIQQPANRIVIAGPRPLQEIGVNRIDAMQPNRSQTAPRLPIECGVEMCGPICD